MEFKSWIAAANKEKQQEALAKAITPGPGRGHKTVTTNSTSRFSRDRKKDDAQSTDGQLAAKADVSIHKLWRRSEQVIPIAEPFHRYLIESWPNGTRARKLLQACGKRPDRLMLSNLTAAQLIAFAVPRRRAW